MKFTINTEKLKDMVSRAIKGAGNNKLIPITSLIAIKLVNGVLTFVTTDATNYLYIQASGIEGDDFYAVVSASTLSKLVSKLTCDTTTFEIAGGNWVLNVVGNGSYKIELPLDENGEGIKYPDPYANFTNAVDFGYINRTVVQVILDTIKPALSLSFDNPCYTGYYVGDKVVATDTYKIANMDIPIFEVPKLISPQLMDLLSVITEERIRVTFDGKDTLIFSAGDCVIVGKTMEGLDEFAIEPITELVNTRFEHFCAVPKTSFIQALDRLMIFVGPYDKNEVSLTFTNSGLQISSKEVTGVELIEYVASEKFIDFTCEIDIQMLMQEIKAIQSDVINVYYGDDSSIKLVDGNITIIVAFLEDDN